MEEIISKGREFILTYARLLERRLFEIHFGNTSPSSIAQVIRAYQNPDGGLGYALEPDVRCQESQPLFAGIGLSALEEAGCRDSMLAMSICNFLKSVADSKGLVAFFSEEAFKSPLAEHWVNSTLTPGLNPTADICGLLHYQGIEHDWLSYASDTCVNMIMQNPPLEAHTLCGAARLVEYLPDRKKAMNLLDTISISLPKASFYIPYAPVSTYGLTPLHFASRPEAICRTLFTKEQIDGHLEYLLKQQLPDGGWPISWDAPGKASEFEWRGRITLDALCRLRAYGIINQGCA